MANSECQQCWLTACVCEDGPDLRIDTLSQEQRDRCDSRLENGAYYYQFDATGNEHVDRILGAISLAGKMYHYTTDWNERERGRPSAIEIIQAAANDATRSLKGADPDCEECNDTYYNEIDSIGTKVRCACTYENDDE